MANPLCALCGRNPATYVCQSCGRTVCGNCFDPSIWSCTNCRAKASVPVAQSQQTVTPFSIATWLFFIAFAVIFVGTLLMTIGSLSNAGTMGGGAVILIGPIPIILGVGPYSTVMIGLALVLAIFAVLFYFLLRKRTAR